MSRETNGWDIAAVVVGGGCCEGCGYAVTGEGLRTYHGPDGRRLLCWECAEHVRPSYHGVRNYPTMDLEISRLNGGIASILTVNRSEAIAIIKSLSTQVHFNSRDTGRCDEYPCEGAADRFSIVVLQEPKP